MPTTTEHYPFNLNLSKKTEGKNCNGENWCIPCGCNNNCDVYTCEECRVNMHGMETGEDIDQLGEKYKCSWCCCNDAKMEINTCITHFSELAGIEEDAYDFAVEEGECCVFPTRGKGYTKWEWEQMEKELNGKTKEELIKRLLDQESEMRDIIDACSTAHQRNQELTNKIKTLKVSLGTIQENLLV